MQSCKRNILQQQRRYKVNKLFEWNENKINLRNVQGDDSKRRDSYVLSHLKNGDSGTRPITYIRPKANTRRLSSDHSRIAYHLGMVSEQGRLFALSVNIYKCFINYNKTFGRVGDKQLTEIPKYLASKHIIIILNLCFG